MHPTITKQFLNLLDATRLVHTKDLWNRSSYVNIYIKLLTWTGQVAQVQNIIILQNTTSIFSLALLLLIQES